MARARKAAATVAKGTFSGDLGPLIDTQEYDGLLMLEPAPWFAKETHFHCYAITRVLAGLALKPEQRKPTMVGCLDPSSEASLLQASSGILARYHYGSDHGLLLMFYRDGQTLGDVILSWSPNHGRISDGLANELVRAQVLDPDRQASLMRLLEEVGSTKTGESFRDRTVGLFGFPAYSRLSADACLGIDAEDLRSVGYELFEP